MADEPEEELNHEAWLTPYADMLTLLMALFLMLYAISQLDLRKFEELSSGLNESLGGGGGPGVVDPVGQSGGGGVLDGGGGVADAVVAPVHGARGDGPGGGGPGGARDMIDVERTLRDAAKRQGFADRIDIRRDERGLVVAFGSDGLLFPSGSAVLGPRGRQALDTFAAVVSQVPNPMLVEGHTDSAPIATWRFPSNWELSTARATAVLRYLVANGVPASRVSAAGYADQRPVADGTSAAANQANRRVELVIRDMAQADVPEALAVDPEIVPLGP